MIEFHLNGERMRINTDASVEEFLRAQGFELKFIAIERDREILPRALWTQAKMSEGKSYEVVRFVGGG
ncbi:sulfur carrier protein ThiS [uncultured Campylobacter sp.]|jgi:thiamine biosynthesis protein thiS|uniref:sulfur carrier protein ThiS n=1 Tax=uncultured Campylobacter sp. TaxID=218934 RepID=UPI0025D958F5|nr:sulfur carrier protein ThiS [uncultured Campylobacter sp.]